MRIIITGSSGYIGSKLAQELLDNELLLADKKTGIDITDDFYEKHKNFKPDLIYHLAAQTEVQTKDPLGMIRDNLLGTIEVAKFGCPVIFTSSGGVYGDVEVDVPNPDNIYTITKLAGEKILAGHTILRFSNVYGHGGHGVYEKLKQGAKINGDGEQTRDFIHVSDVVSALIKAQDWQGIFNIGTGIETSINELADKLGVKKEYAPAVKEQRRSCLNITKALNKGWKPLIKL